MTTVLKCPFGLGRLLDWRGGSNVEVSLEGRCQQTRHSHDGVDGLGLVENKKAPHRLVAMRGTGSKECV